MIMNEKEKVRLLERILLQIPLNSKLYVGDYINFMIKDGFMENLSQYEIPEDFPEKRFDKCYLMTSDFINYFLTELKSLNGLVNYFDHYIIMFDDEILLCVYDEDIFSIKSTLLIDDKLINNCNDSEIYIIFEDPVTL